MRGKALATSQFLLCFLKGHGRVTVNKPVISTVYIVDYTVYTWPLCSAQILVHGVNPQESYFQISTNIFAIVFVSLQSSRVHLQNSPGGGVLD